MKPSLPNFTIAIARPAGIAGLLAVACLFAATAGAADNPAGISADYKLLYSQDFSSPDASKDFVFTDAGAWKLSTAESRSALELAKQSKYQPPYRSPVNIALVGDKAFGDFIVEADCLQTGKEYGHRDMVVFFGFQNPSQYYYTHIATKADDHANQIFIVNEAPRLKISRVSNDGNPWGLNVWRHVRLEREIASGAIRVYFEDMAKPIMVAEDKTFGAGWLGFGSFDDTGKIANIKVWGKSAEDRRVPEFPKK